MTPRQPKPKQQVNYRLSEEARHIIRTIAERDQRSQGITLEIILKAEAKRQGIKLPK